MCVLNTAHFHKPATQKETYLRTKPNLHGNLPRCSHAGAVTRACEQLNDLFSHSIRHVVFKITVTGGVVALVSAARHETVAENFPLLARWGNGSSIIATITTTTSSSRIPFRRRRTRRGIFFVLDRRRRRRVAAAAPEAELVASERQARRGAVGDGTWGFLLDFLRKATLKLQR